MSNDLAKAAAFAAVITGKQIKVLAGKPEEGPHTIGRNIVFGQALSWDKDDRFAVLVHECCHHLFPANYPNGNIRQIANLIDDCRIERQFIDHRPHYEAVLANLAINVIANGLYDEQQRDPWSVENFEPCLWVLLFFRPHVGEEVQLAASDAINAYIETKGYDKQAGWKEKFSALVTEGQRITRLKTISKDTLEKWCLAYFDVFPEAKKAINQVLSVAVLSDQPSPKGEQQDVEGAGDPKQDQTIKVRSGAGTPSEDDQEGDSEGDQEGDSEEAKGAKESQETPHSKPGQKGGKGTKKPSEGEAQGPSDLAAALEKAKATVGEVGRTKKAQAQIDAAGETGGGGEQQTVEIDPEEVGGGIGSEKGTIEAAKIADCVDRNFTNRVKMSMRKLRSLVLDRIAGHRKTGRLHLPTVVNADRLGILARKPFISQIDEITDAPVACVVATDFSISTSGINGMLNTFAHNALYALQSAGCECSEVVWNMEASITKSLDEQVSAVRGNKHTSRGGTSLVACGTGCVQSLLRAKSPRKVAFVFTDGEVYESEVPLLSIQLKNGGFEACLLVSLGSSVKPYGIVGTETCTNVSDLIKVFDRFVRKQSAKAAQEQYA